MSDRRLAARQASLVFYDLVHAHDGARFGDLVDLSPTGLMAVCDEAVLPGTRLSLQMDIAARMIGTRTLHFEAECRWCSRVDEGGYACGLEVVVHPSAVVQLPHLAHTMLFDQMRSF